MTNRYTTGRRGKAADRAAAARFVALRDAGVPTMLTSREAWHLSGGVIGEQHDTESTVPLARVARDVPDAEQFLDDYRLEVAGNGY